MKIVTWNVNGLRACLGKGFMDAFRMLDADAFCLQETKMQEGQAEVDSPGFAQYWNSAEKKGYSGTAVFTRRVAHAVQFGLGMEVHDQEGRVVTLDYGDFYLVNVYTPNAQRELTRLSYRMQWEDDFRAYLVGLDEKKPVIVCGDLNVAHREIDLKNPKANRRNAGFTIEERDKMTALLASGFCDAFRWLYPDKRDAYTWWSYMGQARARNVGWRIDCFLVSERLKDTIREVQIFDGIMGSDHCPVALTITL